MLVNSCAHGHKCQHWWSDFSFRKMKRKSDAQSDCKKALKEDKEQDASTSFHYSDNKKSLYRPPTSEEISSLKETENLFQSSLLHMQINELLSEVSLKKKQKTLQETLHLLNDLLLSLPDGTEHDLTDLAWLPGKIHVPLPPLPGTAKGKFQFLKPKSVNVVGSYLLGTLCKPQLNIDIAVQIPKECIHGKDYLNLRYHYKRGLYLTIIASYIRKSKLFKKPEFSLQSGDLWKPILVLKPKDKTGRKFIVKIFITLPTGTFKLARLAPKVNNIRQNWFYGEHNIELGEPTQTDSLPSTPHYNSSIMMDMLMEQHLHYLYSKVSPHQSLVNAVILCKVWLHQRQVDKGFQGFTGFHVSMIIAYFLQTHQINQHMSCYQILRIFWQFLASKDFTTEDCSMVVQKLSTDEHMPSLSDFHDNFEVVFVDSSGYLNLFANMSGTAIKQVSSEARLALEILDKHVVDGFDVLFIKNEPLITRYDNFFHFKDVAVFKSAVRIHRLNCELLDRAGDWVKVGISWMEKLLAKALGNRIDLLLVWPETSPMWSLQDEPPLTSQCSVTVGFLLNSDYATNILEKGPSADQLEAKTFREFWGDKSELRRFQDGSISEAVVWTCKTASEKRTICEQIIKHILNRHGSIDPSQIVFSSTKLESLLKQRIACTSKVANKNDVFESGTGEEVIQAVIRTYEALGRQLRGLDLPLSVHSIQGLSPVLRGTEVCPPVPRFVTKHDVRHDTQKHMTVPVLSNKTPSWCPVSEVLLQFETSGQWPDDIEAVRRIKAAFLLKIANLLMEDCNLQAIATTTYLDVIKDGFVFRIKLGYHREMVLLQQSSELGSLRKLHDSRAKDLKREIVHLPFLSSVIHGIQQQFSSFGGSVRLAKRWISSHMLLFYFSEECVELLMAYVFLSPSPYRVPGSPVVGFLRFLLLLSTFDWKNNPLIVNLNNELTATDYQSIHSQFSNNRTQMPAMFIATPRDKQSSYWSKDNPSLLILKRLCMLAKETFAVLCNQLTQSDVDAIDFKEVFRPPLGDYDVIITLHTNFNPRCSQATDSNKVLTYQTKSTLNKVLPVVNFNPVDLYIQELRESFDDIAMFFHDTFGGNMIGVVWKPTAFEPSRFKVLHSQYRIPADNLQQNKDPMVVPNIHAILSDFKILGEGLVKDIKTAKLPT